MPDSEQYGDLDLGMWPRRILSALEKHGGEGTSSEITEFLAANNTTQVNYHVKEHLEPRGLVDTHQPQSDPGPNAPKKYYLTEAGEEALDQIAEEQDLHRGLAERLDRLEERFESLQAENHDLREENQELREQIGELETGGGTPAGDVDDVDGLQKQVAKLANEVEDLKDDPVFDEGVKKGIDDFRVGLLALTDYLVEEFDAKDEIAELEKGYLDEIDPLSQHDRYSQNT